jgi:hypothetical protein
MSHLFNAPYPALIYIYLSQVLYIVTITQKRSYNLQSSFYNFNKIISRKFVLKSRRIEKIERANIYRTYCIYIFKGDPQRYTNILFGNTKHKNTSCIYGFCVLRVM